MLGSGTTITFQTGYLAEVLSMAIEGMSRPAVPNSHFGTTGADTFQPANNYNPGQLVVEAHRDPTASPVTPIAAAAETVTVTYPDGSTEASSGFLVDWSQSAPNRAEKVVETLRIQRTGNVTITPAP